MLCGFGQLVTKTTGLPGGIEKQIMTEHFWSSWELTEESDSKTAQGFKGGKLVTMATAENTVTSTLKIQTEYVDWAQFGFSLGQFERSHADFKVPAMEYATVPTSGPYTVAVPGLDPNDAEIYVYVNAFGNWGEPGSLTRLDGAVANRVFSATPGQIEFDAAQAGSPVTIAYSRTLSTAKAYGGSGAKETYGDLEFWGQLYGTEQSEPWLVHIPKLQRSSRPNISIAGDVPTLEVEFGAITPAGWEDPYMFVNMAESA